MAWRERLGLALIVAACVPVATASALPAVGRVSVSGGFSGVPRTVQYEGLIGNENLVVTGSLFSAVTIRDIGGGVLYAASGCVSSGTSEVTCYDPYLERVLVTAGRGTDIVDTRGWGGAAVVLGEAGYDTILTGNGSDRLSGGEGDDLLASAGGDDEIQGGPGADKMYGGSGSDVLWSNEEELLPVRDLLDCGSGIDMAFSLAPDLVTNCETSF